SCLAPLEGAGFYPRPHPCYHGGPVACPRCGFEGGGAPAAACERCGVVFAKMGAARPRPAATRPATPPARRAASGRGGAWILGAAIAAAGGFGLYVWLRPPAPVEAPAVAADAPEAVPAARAEAEPSLPPPSLEPLAGPAEPIALPAEAVPAADREQAETLVRRLAGAGAISTRDVQVAEQLYARYPQEEPVRELLERVLVTAAATESRSKRLAPAATLLRRATEVQPASLDPWIALAQVQFDQGDFTGAEAAARAALGLAPRSFEALQVLAYALVRQDRNREAEETLRAALDVRRDAATQAMLDRVRKGLADEKGMAERQLAHFHVRYDGDAHEDVGREILGALERHYATLARTLGHEPQAPVPVILFSRQAYYDASGAPAWSGGVFDSTDGRIRIPIGGLTTSLTPDMDETLIHELTHAFVADLSQGLAPRDIHEGFAQYMEGRRLDQTLTEAQITALADGRFSGVSGFYLAALAYVEHLIALRGMGGMVELLRAMGETRSVDKAFVQVHGQDQKASRLAWAQRLRMQYGS
ncbi:MAG TPA: tetratricopeptide repeat protein, partial [Vicinamibacteria bacterium]|nr:tetratricopeptide repeat protein [Vicinamibacteria bacterium]